MQIFRPYLIAKVPVFYLRVSLQLGSPNFFSEGHISYYTTVRGLDILRNVIVLGYFPFYQINKFFVNIWFFHNWQNAFTGQIWPADRSLEPLLCNIRFQICHKLLSDEPIWLIRMTNLSGLSGRIVMVRNILWHWSRI